ncbi:MazG-like family protein, partial [Streptomyces albidoflavus]|uniref:MazG-like family protein n=1 Tax=Streptomyces albidoflavus TaxID=1886 RepID=UPI0027B9A2DB
AGATGGAAGRGGRAHRGGTPEAVLEIFQWLTPEQAQAVMDDPESAFRVRDEVADVLAYTLQFCEVLGIDALEALAAKIDRNERRFPAGPYPLDR